MRSGFLSNYLIAPPLAALLITNAATQDSDVVLTFAEPIHGHIRTGEEHRYQLVLEAGEFASVVVEQKGIDVGVLVRDGENAVAADYQDEIRRDGEERVEIVAGNAGANVLAITPANGATVAG